MSRAADAQSCPRTRVRDVVAICHPRAVLIFSALVFVTAWIAERGRPPIVTTIALVAAMALEQVAIGVMNDYCDRDLDRVAKPERGIPAGLVPPHVALATTCAAACGGLFIATTVSGACALVLAVASAMGLLYSAVFKRSWLSWLPYAIAYPIVPLWVWMSLGEFRPHLFVLFPVSVPVSVGIHLCNQLRDYDDDAELGMRGFAQLLGKNTAGTACLTLLVGGPFIGALLASQGSLRAGSMLGLVTLVHWWAIGRCVAGDRGRRRPELWKELFQSLQVTAPLLLTGWLVTFSP